MPEKTKQAKFDFKYNEDTILDDLVEYIKSTYGQHYADGESGLQIQDLFHSIGIAIPFCQANAIKYLTRYGKKDGKNLVDLQKTLHYTILLLHFAEYSTKNKK